MYMQYILYSHLLSQMWGGVMFFLHFMLFPTFLEQINSGNKKIIIIFVEKLFLLI